MITYERQKDGTLKQVDSPPKRAELVEQRIYDRCLVRVGQLEAEKATLCARIDELCAEVERLKEREQNLVTVLRNDCDIEASWDGLRKFWYIGLTENGCLMRDMACKAEAENAKLRELASELWVSCPVHDSDCDECRHKGGRTGCELYDRMLELGIEATA